MKQSGLTAAAVRWLTLRKAQVFFEEGPQVTINWWPSRGAATMETATAVSLDRALYVARGRDRTRRYDELTQRGP